MIDDALRVASSRRLRRLRQLARAFADRDFRHAFMGRQLRLFLAEQIRALRGNKSQKEFGNIVGKPQSVISRLEKQAGKNVSIQTLIDIAEKLDIAVVIRFVNFPTFLRSTDDYSEEAVAPARYDQETMDRLVATLETGASAIIPQAFESIPQKPLGPKPPTDMNSIQQAPDLREQLRAPKSNVIPLRDLQQPRLQRSIGDVGQSRRYGS